MRKHNPNKVKERTAAMKGTKAHRNRKGSNSSSKTAKLVTRILGAKSVSVTGDFTGWSEEGIPMHNGSGDEWETELVLAPGEYQYRLRVDGRWQDHVEARERRPNSFGTENCILTVS
jgi:1,4-alpha-glucan branching enzyme